jgi:hypothetical protein
MCKKALKKEKQMIEKRGVIWKVTIKETKLSEFFAVTRDLELMAVD